MEVQIVIIQNNQLDICVSRDDNEDNNIGKKVLVHFYEVLSKNNKTLRDKNIDNLIEDLEKKNKKLKI